MASLKTSVKTNDVPVTLNYLYIKNKNQLKFTQAERIYQ